jgi:hypothetical protein
LKKRERTAAARTLPAPAGRHQRTLFPGTFRPGAATTSASQLFPSIIPQTLRRNQLPFMPADQISLCRKKKKKGVTIDEGEYA